MHVNDPSLNKNLGKYQLPYIWDEVQQDTPSLYLKWSATAITTLLNGPGPCHMGYKQIVTFVSMALPPGSANSPLFTSVHQTWTGAIYGKYRFFGKYNIFP